MDRLTDLRRAARQPVPTAEARPIPADVPRESIEVAALVAGVQRSDAAMSDVEAASLASASAASSGADAVPPEMQRFFASVAEARAQLAGLRRQLDGLDRLLQKFKAEFNPEAQRRVGEAIKTAIAAIHPDLSACQSNLQRMQAELERVEEQLPEDYSGSELRAQQNLVTRLHQDASSLVDKFLTLQKTHETWHHTTVTRQIEINAGSALTAEEKAVMAEDCLERGVSVFKEGVEGGLRKKQAEILLQVEAHHAGAVQVERNIAELAELFESLSLLVNAQGEAIDRVEAHVSAA
jgi:syntaxin 1B/2/3